MPGLALAIGAVFGARALSARHADAATMASIDAEKPATLLELRAAESARLNSGPMPIEEAMRTLAARGRLGAGSAIVPKQSKDISPLLGWAYKPRDVPDWLMAAGASPAPSGATPEVPGAAASAAPAGDGAIELKLASLGNTMTYDTKTLTVQTGAKVHLVFHNSSTMDMLPHNWVCVRPGTEAAVAAEGLKAGQEAGFLDAKRENVIAFTPLATMGKSVETTFTAPAVGTYPYVCTVPGHYVMMKGSLVVTP